ncbi:MAG TPA: hypothetical protein VFO46_02190 [Candidatus Sulfotelmatobacter sp.]|nr:hypothetical protein [Candidatus Sulfotelmatobacter sp.]
MKRTFVVLMTVMVLAGLAIWVPKTKHSIATLPVVHAQNGCANTTLTGNYLPHYSGSDKRWNKYTPELPITAVGVGTFDGAGNVSFSYNDVLNNDLGGINPPDVGTYSVNSDCTFALTDPGAGQTWAGAIRGGGSEWDMVVTAGPTASMSRSKQ